MTTQQKECRHDNFEAAVEVNRIEQEKGGTLFSADIRIQCADCGTAFRFLGLPAGVDLTGAATSVDAKEARLAIAPEGEVRAVIDDGGVHGFTVKKTQ